MDNKHIIHTLYMLIKKWETGEPMSEWDKEQFEMAKAEIKELYPEFIFHKYNKEIE